MSFTNAERKLRAKQEAFDAWIRQNRLNPVEAERVTAIGCIDCKQRPTHARLDKMQRQFTGQIWSSSFGLDKLFELKALGRAPVGSHTTVAQYGTFQRVAQHQRTLQHAATLQQVLTDLVDQWHQNKRDKGEVKQQDSSDQVATQLVHRAWNIADILVPFSENYGDRIEPALWLAGELAVLHVEHEHAAPILNYFESVQERPGKCLPVLWHQAVCVRNKLVRDCATVLFWQQKEALQASQVT